MVLSGCLFPVGLLEVAAELKAHGGKQLVGEIRLTARGEPFVQSGGENGRRHGLVNRRLDSPAPFAGIGNAAGEFFQSRILDERYGGTVKQPRSNHAASAPDL